VLSVGWKIRKIVSGGSEERNEGEWERIHFIPFVLELWFFVEVQFPPLYNKHNNNQVPVHPGSNF
jgi:hypothetical protein